MNQEKEQFKNNLKKVAAEQGSRQAISYEDLFNPRFMQKNTSFVTIDVFVKELGAKSFPDIDHLDKKIVDQFVKKETRFNSWEEMQQRAINEYMTSLF
ncbi:hypothetical protein [Lactobacillus helveticus]|jgi:hypothetical protein|uniref:Uncharacterized protein n=2 Tax=Lactobacillus helveticus TaxID=1587 RepID=U4QAM6_LACHE|nr:hypothetical protein [Lactobacillus helveticus]ADX69901.1 Putative uncharacterized protein [Lactobacillus helveticus H10]AFR21737.1 hypothetical protein R0052_04185 [Lactobacillus helveticus R0052]ALI52302.1 hypothetical protein ALV80_03820 [Lactobacillus helveticus]AZK90339.1 hypothetical protein LH5_00077 [Lactobacillus helveticus]KRO15449.1 hypothetical protein IV62_GL001796 [Lactobacillus helveticus]